MATETPELGQAKAEAVEWKHGWPTVLSAAIGYGGGPVLFLTTASVFIKPTIQATGWSTTEVLISPFISFLLAALGPLVGRVADRTSPKRTVAVGLALYTVLLVLFALVPFNRGTYYGLGAAIGIAGAFAYMVPINRAVAAWFYSSSGKAFGMVGVGGAAMPLIGIPAVAYVIYTFGWQKGYLALAAFALVIALPSVLIGLRSRPADEVYEHERVTAARHRISRSEGGAILRTPRFWVLFVSIVFATGAASAFLANMQPILLDGGLSVVAATSITTLATVGVIVGRIGTGALLDAANIYVVTAVVLAVSGVAGIALSQTSAMPYALVFVSALVVAFSQGADADAFGVITLKNYGRKSFSLMFSVCYVASGIGSLTMPYVFGFVRDAAHSYRIPAVFGGILYLAAALCTLAYAVWGLRSRRARAGAGSGAAEEQAATAAS